MSSPEPNFNYDLPRLSATVICTPPPRAQQLASLANASGCSIRSAGVLADFLLADLCSDTSATDGDWQSIADYLRQYDSQAVVWVRLEAIDTAFAALPTGRCHFLVDAQDWQAVPILSGAFRRVKLDRVQEGGDESELGALHRISGELADFARTLARIAEQDAALPPTVRDAPIGFRAAPRDLFQPMVPPATLSDDRSRASQIREMIKLRRLRERFFDAELFADPSWDIMLDLYAAEAEGKQVSVSSLCIAAAVPPTTALRWITNMTEMGLLERKQDPYDARRVYITLAPASSAKLDAYFAACDEKLAIAI
jgi:DNA-binding MarR family transcriptional regulator